MTRQGTDLGAAYNENFAQVYVMIAYNTQVRSIYNYDVTCMSNQIEYGQDLLEHLVDYYPSASCSRRWSEEDSPRVCMGPKARWARKCRGIPDPVIPEPEPEPTPVPTPTPTPDWYDEDDDGKVVKGEPVGVPVDEVARKKGIVVEENKVADQEKDAQRWGETLERAGYGR